MTTLQTDFSPITDADPSASVHPAWSTFKRSLAGREWGGDVLHAAWLFYKEGWVAAKLLTPPTDGCEVCNAPAGEWCNPGCVERPRPGGDPARPTQEQMGTLIADSITMLNASLDEAATQAKNYVEINMDWPSRAIKDLPFSRASLTFYRDGGLSPHARATIALNEALDAKTDVERLTRYLDEERARVRSTRLWFDAAKHKIIAAIERDLRGRKIGLDDVDGDVMTEIRTSWLEIIEKAGDVKPVTE